jgi:hypothetical protein
MSKPSSALTVATIVSAGKFLSNYTIIDSVQVQKQSCRESLCTEAGH